MKRITYLLFWVILIFLFAQFLPWLYSYFTVKPTKTPYTRYSSVVEEFAQIIHGEDGITRADRRGRVYTEAQFDSILPFLYLRQLVSEERFPDSIKGVPIDARSAQNYSFMLRVAPQHYLYQPMGLYPLFESNSKRVDLKMPSDYFRINGKEIEFIDVTTNSKDSEKSTLFTQALSSKGFKFPAKKVWGNPTPKKEYDEGYFIKDNFGKLFQLKMSAGEPVVSLIDAPAESEILHLEVMEIRSKLFLALAFDSDGAAWLLNRSPQQWIKLPVKPVDLSRERFIIMAEPLHWTIQVGSENSVDYFAIDASNYTLVDTMHIDIEPNMLKKAEDWLFPFQLKLVTPADKSVGFRFSDYSIFALILNVLLALVIFLIDRGGRSLPFVAVTTLCGLFSFIPYLLYRNYFANRQ
ncbi:MAG: DUF4857 domain-containing protein [Bacteroidales bacterium]